MNLTHLLLLYNSTFNALNNVPLKRDDTWRLMREVEQTIMDGCPFDCCDEAPFIELNHLRLSMDCSERSSYFVRCRHFVKRFDTLETQETAMKCYQQHFAHLFPFVFRDFSTPADEASCASIINDSDLDYIDSLLRSTAIFNHLKAIDNDSLKNTEINVLTSCFWPDSPPLNFDDKSVRNAIKSKKAVLNMRMQYIAEDISKELLEYNLNELPTKSGSGIL